MPKHLPKSVYREIYSRVPRLTVDVVMRMNGDVVLVKRDIPPCKGYWHLPGGTVLLGEDLQDAARRVAKDETGLRVEVERQLGVKEYSRRSAFGQTVSVVYSANVISGKLRGNKYGRLVKAFKELPTKLISEQKELLRRWGHH